MSKTRQQPKTSPKPPPLTGPEVAHFSMSPVARFSMSLAIHLVIDASLSTPTKKGAAIAAPNPIQPLRAQPQAAAGIAAGAVTATGTNCRSLALTLICSSSPGWSESWEV